MTLIFLADFKCCWCDAAPVTFLGLFFSVTRVPCPQVAPSRCTLLAGFTIIWRNTQKPLSQSRRCTMNTSRCKDNSTSDLEQIRSIKRHTDYLFYYSLLLLLIHDCFSPVHWSDFKYWDGFICKSHTSIGINRPCRLWNHGEQHVLVTLEWKVWGSHRNTWTVLCKCLFNCTRSEIQRHPEILAPSGQTGEKAWKT